MGAPHSPEVLDASPRRSPLKPLASRSARRRVRAHERKGQATAIHVPSDSSRVYEVCGPVLTCVDAQGAEWRVGLFEKKNARSLRFVNGQQHRYLDERPADWHRRWQEESNQYFAAARSRSPM